MPFHLVDDPGKLRRLMEAVLMLEADLSLPVLLRHVVEEACDLSGARYGALGVLDERREGLEQFLTVGLDEEQERAIGRRPTGQGVLGLLITDPAPLRMSDIGDHRGRAGFPPNHPVMRTFLGVPVRVRGEVYGNLYLAEKGGGADFTEEDEALVGGLAVAAGIAIENARLHGRVRELTLLEDRDRIARDLHDTVIQRLFAVGLSLQGTARLAQRPEVVERIEAAVRDLDETIGQVRTAIYDLEMSMRGPGMRQAVLDAVLELAPTLGFAPSVSFSGPVDAAVPAGVGEHLVATVREALTNVARHAGARHVSVSLAVGEDIRLEVVDDGRGISHPPGEPDRGPLPASGGHGLRNLRSRAEKLGGTLTVTSAGEAGTRLAWLVPL